MAAKLQAADLLGLLFDALTSYKEWYGIPYSDGEKLVCWSCGARCDKGKEKHKSDCRRVEALAAMDAWTGANPPDEPAEPVKAKPKPVVRRKAKPAPKELDLSKKAADFIKEIDDLIDRIDELPDEVTEGDSGPFIEDVRLSLKSMIETVERINTETPGQRRAFDNWEAAIRKFERG